MFLMHRLATWRIWCNFIVVINPWQKVGKVWPVLKNWGKVKFTCGIADLLFLVVFPTNQISKYNNTRSSSHMTLFFFPEMLEACIASFSVWIWFPRQCWEPLPHFFLPLFLILPWCNDKGGWVEWVSFISLRSIWVLLEFL